MPTVKHAAPSVPINAPDDQCFWVNNGPVLKNLRELEAALKRGEISDDQFRYHTSDGRNDFSAWIGSVLKDEVSAKALARVKTKKTALRILSEHLKSR